MFTKVEASYVDPVLRVMNTGERGTSLFSPERFKLRFIFVPAVTPAER